MENFINDFDKVKNSINSGKVRNIYDLIDGKFVSKHDFEYDDVATIIFELVQKHGEGFVVDICERVLESIKNGRTFILSDKQRWCVAFAALKLSADMVDEMIADNEQIVAESEALWERFEAERKARFAKVEDDEEVTEQPVEVETIEAEDIRLVNEYQESGRVFIHTTDGRTIVRMMTSSEVCGLQTIRKREGGAALKAAVAKIFNEKYAAPQHIRRVPLSAEDEEYFIRVAFRRLTGVCYPAQL